MRAWERQEGETDKAWQAFQTYRDLGVARSHRTVAELLYSDRAVYGLRTVEKWSSRFDWVARVRALEARDEMIARDAVESHLASKAAELAARRAALSEKAVEIAEAAAEQAITMLRWPLSEQTVEEEGQVFRISPARWTKSNIKSMFEVTVAGATGILRAAENEEDPAELDFDNFSEEELKIYIELTEKLGIKRRDE